MREFELLQHIFAASRDLGGSVLIPPGDDMALLRLGGGRPRSISWSRAGTSTSARRLWTWWGARLCPAP